MLLSKNCVERDYSLISLVLTMVKLINMSCDKIPNEVSFVYNKITLYHDSLNNKVLLSYNRQKQA